MNAGNNFGQGMDLAMLQADLHGLMLPIEPKLALAEVPPISSRKSPTMPTTPLQRLLFAQGGDCFFCLKTLSKVEASVEHLVPLTYGGKDNDENCVACCKSLNNLFGRMSLKEKIKIVLNQRGSFTCPALASSQPAAASTSAKPVAKKALTHDDRFSLVLTDLQKRGNARPRTTEKLLNTIKSLMSSLGEPPSEADGLLGELKARNYVAINGAKVSYTLPNKSEV